MPPKKNEKKDTEPDESTNQLLAKYKKKCELYQITTSCKQFVSKVRVATEDNDHIYNLHIWEEMDVPGINAIFDTLSDLHYKHIISIRFWKIKTFDEGLKSICDYVKKNSNCIKLDLLENMITSVGCQMLFPILTNECNLQNLKLDYNLIGTKGLQQLSIGLAQNKNLISLSLNFCGIDSLGAMFLQEILANLRTSLEKLKLQGNFLQNEGVYQIFRALESNDILEKINLADNQFGECDDIPVIDKICEVMIKNTSLGVYKLKFNGIYDQSAKRFLECIQNGKHIYICELSEHISNDLLADIKKSMKKHKPKKKKKGKKGKKGKKK